MTDTLSAGTSLGASWLDRALAEAPRDGDTHQALASLDGRIVALSIVAPRRLSGPRAKRFGDVAARRARLRGDGLLPLVASGRGDDCLFAAYEIGSAVPLSAWREEGDLSTHGCLQMLWGIARALDSAVSQGVLPVEVSPESVFVTPDGEAALGDLGVAREALGNPPATRDRNAAWVAPEVLAGGEATPRSAVYSFGALLYTLLSGAAPRREGTRRQMIQAEPPRLSEIRPDLPPDVDLMLAMAMARDPAKRHETAGQARRMADVLLQDEAAADVIDPRRRLRLRDRPASAPKVSALRRLREKLTAAMPKPPPTKPDRVPPAPPANGPAPARGQVKPPQAPPARPPAHPASAAARPQAPPEPARGEVEPPQPLPEPARGHVEPPPPVPARPRSKALVPRGPRAVVSTRTRRPTLSPGMRNVLIVALFAPILGAIAGILLSDDDAPESSSPTRLGGGAMSVEIPASWEGTAASAGALQAHPAGAPAAGLDVEVVNAAIEREEQGTPVLLGRYEAWRDDRAPSGGGQPSVRFVIPTGTGKVVASCEAPSGAGGRLLATCERVASTLRLRRPSPVPLTTAVKGDEVWDLVAGRLRVDRLAARRTLARAERPAGQWQAALALARVHERAERRFSQIPGGEAVVLAARETAAAYRELAAAARRHDRGRWNEAREDVARAEAELSDAVAAG